MYIEWDICLITTATENSTDTNTEYWWPPPHSLAAQDESSLASINLSGIWPRLMATPALASSAPSLLAHFSGLMFTHVYMLTYTATQIHTLQSPLAATPDRWALMTHAFVQSPSANPCIPEWPHTPSASQSERRPGEPLLQSLAWGWGSPVAAWGGSGQGLLSPGRLLGLPCLPSCLSAPPCSGRWACSCFTKQIPLCLRVPGRFFWKSATNDWNGSVTGW